jgi:hypothetical protein
MTCGDVKIWWVLQNYIVKRTEEFGKLQTRLEDAVKKDNTEIVNGHAMFMLAFNREEQWKNLQHSDSINFKQTDKM